MAMLTCAVGIANAMLMSVTERYREIATMKCLGAQDALVVKLFLLESGVQGVFGAVVGLPLGFLVAIVAALGLYGQYGWDYFPWTQAVVIWGMAPIAATVSLITGLILAVAGAVGPAIMAARMKPVDALRVEE
jgi:ABC-type antimicrobial peptide transport system permease subunit